jgi:hypothetical protein
MDLDITEPVLRQQFKSGLNGAIVLQVLSYTAFALSVAEENEYIAANQKLKGLKWFFLVPAVFSTLFYLYFIRMGEDKYVQSMLQAKQHNLNLYNDRVDYVMGMSPVMVTFFFIAGFYFLLLMQYFPYRQALHYILGDKYNKYDQMSFFGFEKIIEFCQQMSFIIVFGILGVFFARIYHVNLVVMSAAVFLVIFVVMTILEKAENEFFDNLYGSDGEHQSWFGFRFRVNEEKLKDAINEQTFPAECSGLSIRHLSEDSDFPVFLKAVCDRKQDLVKQYTRKYSRIYHPDRVRTDACKTVASDTQAVINNMRQFCLASFF